METRSSQRTIGEYNLTPQMDDIIDAVQAGDNIKGFAFAGAGKSTLLRAIEKYHSKKKGLYICYNKSLEREARKLFKGHTVDIATGHSFALNSFEPDVRDGYLRKVGLKLSLQAVHEYANINTEDPEYKMLELDKSVNIITSTAEQYIASASEMISDIHLSQSAKDKISQLIKKKQILAKNKSEIYIYIVNQAKKLIRSMLDHNNNCPCSHDLYLKAWQLSKPKIKYSYIMFDEAQDGNPVILSVILRQKAQQIFVGDKYQSIYQFRGGVNAMDVIPYEAFPLSCSFRYGQRIADLATRILRHLDDKIRITGLGFDTRIVKGSDYEGTEPFLYLAHTNSNLLEVVTSCYQAGIEAAFTSNKASFTAKKIRSIISIHEGGEPLISQHKRYKDIESLARSERDLETKNILEWLNEDISKVKTLARALEWSADISQEEAQIHLSTAHMSKGLEYDVVMLGDDFRKVIASFGDGKPLDESEVNLLYVAVTRPKKTLILPDELYLALEQNLTFTINKTVIPKCYTDNLVPEELLNSNTRSKPVANVQNKKIPKAVVAAVQQELPKQQEPTVNTQVQPPVQKAASLYSSPSKTSPVKADTPIKQPNLKANVENKPKPKELEQDNGTGIRIEVGQHKDKAGNKIGANYWEPTNTNEALNPNIAIVGTMGTGKTQTVKSMLTQLVQQRGRNPDGESFGALIFDYKSDYCDDEFIHATGAQLIEPIDLPINPLVLHSDDRRAMINTSSVFCSTLGKIFNLGVKQDRKLNEFIELAYESRGIYRGETETYSRTPPTVNEVIKLFMAQDKVPDDSLTSALDKIERNELFESNSRKCKSLYDTLENNVVVISLGGVASDLQNLIVAVLLDQFYIQMHLNPKPVPTEQYRALKKMILVDEADNFMSQDFESLRKILKEGREFGVGVALSTQGLDHFETKENNYRSYVTHWICHRLVEPKSKDVVPLLNTKAKTELESRILEIRELEKHQSLYINGRKEVIPQESTAFWCLPK
ncbi:DUF87 domain-containing protein [Vibrio aestuarianus subsp. cardii]|uniref:UvrD-helicase domain-containing protein n=1 Tax=Vibrio aestuarianus TaxID=28171 RepID=UPI0015596EA9|nr:UvrD-helicase domain-containing protein [Vibrio aestuarianus]NGZ66581.1 DUF87 domain-containing protein [Vibrio aestuarianus subsp. cardii]